MKNPLLTQTIALLLLLALGSPLPAATPNPPAPHAPAPVAAAMPAPADEFQAVAGQDEFTSLESTAVPGQPTAHEFKGEAKAFRWVLGIMAATLVAGLLARFSAPRNLRAVFLVASLAVLGFYKGACPCPIQSLHYSFLNLLGHAYKWQTLVYLLGLLPLTYLFGRVFCGWILVGVLVLASVLIHRPFCKTLCPIGLILGWVGKIPGASILGPNSQCLGCSVCHTSCKINAITRDGRTGILENQECIRCGECLDRCRTSSLAFHRRGRAHPDRVEMKCPPAVSSAVRAPDDAAVTSSAPVPPPHRPTFTALAVNHHSHATAAQPHRNNHEHR